VLQPEAVRGLSLALHYFHITVDDAIGLTGTTNILNGCYNGGVDEYCGLVVRNNSGRIQYVNDFYANIGTHHDQRYRPSPSAARFPRRPAASPSASTAATSSSTTSL